jgi:hypothetical protein
MKDGIEMGVVVMEFNGKRCGDRMIQIWTTSKATSQPYYLTDMAAIIPKKNRSYKAFLPAFYFRQFLNHETQFMGIELRKDNLECITSVGFLAEFKKQDLIMDYFIPNDLSSRGAVLYQQVQIPGFGKL